MSWLHSSVFSVFKNKAKQTGEVGIEVEMEGAPTWLRNELDTSWLATLDGSLKDAHALEYVLKAPVARNDVAEAVNRLYSNISKVGGIIRPSMRAGVHIHINCQQLSILQLINFIVTYYCIEDALTENLGADRVGNLFCLRISDAEAPLSRLNGFIRSKSMGYLQTDDIRYAALNLTALAKYGSLEFRALKTPTQGAEIIEWVDTLLSIKDASMRFGSPVQILNAFSANGVEAMIIRILGEERAKRLIFNQSDFEHKIYSNLRQLQLLSYTNNWDDND
jgi:hypothetical protein